MYFSKILTLFAGGILAVCLMISVTTLTVLRNAIDENGEMQKQAEKLVDRLDESVEALDGYEFPEIQIAKEQESLDPELEVSGTVEENYLIKDTNGKIGLYRENGDLIRLFDVPTDSLPKADRDALQNGIRVTKSELKNLIRDLGVS